MDAESVGLVSIAIGLLLVIGVVRGTWKKVLGDVGLASASSGAAQPVPTPQPIPADSPFCADNPNQPGCSSTTTVDVPASYTPWGSAPTYTYGA